MKTPVRYRFDPNEAERFPWVRFSLITAAEAALPIMFLIWFWPLRLVEEQSAPLWSWFLTVNYFALCMSLFEYLFHRYMLHRSTLPFSKMAAQAHKEHHGLTAVKADVKSNAPEKLVPVRSEFAIEKKGQEVSMMFPWWTLLVFYGLFFVLFGLPVFMLFPHAPVLVCLWVAITFNYTGYEVWHAILHLPFEKFWYKPLYVWRIKSFVQKIYAHHVTHHYFIDCNESIVGCWGYALWDRVFRTRVMPVNMPFPGGEICYNDVKAPKPRWPISAIDKAHKPISTCSRALEKWVAGLFRRPAESV